MADWAKIALKTGLIVVVMAGIWLVFNQIQVPSVDFTQLTNGLGKIFAIANHWLPVFNAIWLIIVALLGVELALITFRFGIIAVRWLFKVNE